RAVVDDADRRVRLAGSRGVVCRPRRPQPGGVAEADIGVLEYFEPAAAAGAEARDDLGAAVAVDVSRGGEGRSIGGVIGRPVDADPRAMDETGGSAVDDFDPSAAAAAESEHDLVAAEAVDVAD